LIGQRLSERLGQSFVVEDRPGAATNIATEEVAHAPPDGYTLLAAVSTNTINPALYPNLNFNFIRDIAMIAGLTRSAEVLEVNPALPITSIPELIAYVRTNPGKLSLGSFGTGTISHVAGVMFKREAGIEMVHVPYRGSAPLVVDLLAGQIPVAFDNIQSSIGYIKAGKLRALAVTSATRLPWLPDVPALGDFLQAMRSPGGLVSERRRTRLSQSSIGSIRRSTPDLPILKSLRASPTWQARCLLPRRPTSTNL
jgi:tripartite-type tricarboxylate transporter receptor subunit TctC